MSKKTPAETWKFITDQCAECEKAEKLSDAELAEALQRNYCFACGGTGGHHEGCKGVSGIMALQAELEQAKEALRAGAEQFAIKSDQLAECRTRLATAEALLSKANPFMAHTPMCRNEAVKSCICGLSELRRAIDKAKGAQ